MQPRGQFDTRGDDGRNDDALKSAEPGRPGRLRLRFLAAHGLTAVLLVAAAALLALPMQAQAQTTLVSNVGQTRSGGLGLDTHEGAQAFTTGDNSAGYTVTSVGLDLSSGADPTFNFTVGIWTNSNSNLPGSSLVTLTQPSSLIPGVNEFTTSGIELAANTTYWVVVDSNGGGSVQWEDTAADSEDSTASGWSIADESYDRPYDGDTWSSFTDPFKFRVNGTAIGSTTNSAPVFTEGTSTTRSVAENTASGQNIGGAVTATDADTSDTLTYTLGGTDAAAFGIVSASGQLQTSAALDHEMKSSYAVTVSVSDGNGGADSINVTINVTADRVALVALYNATGGANWTNNTNWLINEALSEWHGVSTDANGRVTQLSLSRNGLSGEIPGELGNLTSLRELSLSRNGLSGEIPVELGNMTSLQELYLLQNMLSGPLPLTLSALSQLLVLDIRETTLCAPVDTAFQAWLATINFQGTVCAPPRPPRPPRPPPSPPPVPDVPTNLLADGGNEQVALSWEAPEDDGGLAITDYEYQINGSGGGWVSIDSTLTAHTVTGLVNGTIYVFQVRAVSAAGRSLPSNRAEATPGVGALDFAHFANGAGTTSDLVFVNVATHPIRPVLYFYDQEGHPMDPASVVDLTEDLEVTEDGALTVWTAMEPLGELTVSTHGRGKLVSGSVAVAAKGPIGGVLRFDLPDIGVAGVGASPPVRDALFPARRQAGGIRTAAALHNLGEEAITVSCRLMSGGRVLEAVEIDLEANGQEARYIEELFTATDTSDFVGSVRCTAPDLFTGIAVELDEGNRIFTTLPVVPVARAGGGGQETVLYFAHFANGGGTTSDLVFVNVSPRPSGPGPTPYHTAVSPSRPALYFYDQEGNLMDPASVVDLTGDLEITGDGALSIQTEMEPLGELTISTHGRGELMGGSVKVVSEGPIGGVLRYALPGIGVTGVGASPPVRDALFPVRQEGGLHTAAAIRNLTESDLVVTCRLMKDGAVLEETEIPLAANGQEARYIEEMFTFTGADRSDFVGSVRCTVPPGEAMFTGVAVELDAGNRIFTTLPVVPVPRAADSQE